MNKSDLILFQRLSRTIFRPRLRNETHTRRFRRALAISGHGADADYPLDTPMPDFETRFAAFRHRMQTEHPPFFAFAAQQCLNASLYLAPVFAETTGIRAWPTLGQLWHNHKPVFYLSERNARRLVRLQTPLDDFAPARDGFTFHVWITLETGAIFDPTILATILVNDPDLQKPGTVVFGNPETVLPNHAYVPLVIGQDVIQRILTNSSLPVAILH